MQKIKDTFLKIVNKPPFQRGINNLKIGLDVLKTDKVSLIVLSLSTIIFLFSQIYINLQKANGLLQPEDEMWMRFFSWIPMVVAMWTLGDFLVMDQFKVRNYINFDKELGNFEAKLTAAAIVGTISIIGLGIANITWVFSGGFQINKDLATIQTFCISPMSIHNVPFCKDCDGSIIIYNMENKILYKKNASDDFQVVTRLNKASYIACVNSFTTIKETCRYEKDREYSLKYETLTIKMFSLSTGGQMGTITRLAATPPNCPFFVTTRNGKSDFPFLTKVDENLIYESIQKILTEEQ